VSLLLAEFADFGGVSQALAEAARLRIRLLGDDLCASMPYAMGLVGSDEWQERGIAVATKPSLLQKLLMRPSAAYLLCWPLAMATMITELPERHKQYLKDRLLEVSEIVGDGVLERLASGVCTMG
jgi:hypothetical protein